MRRLMILDPDERDPTRPVGVSHVCTLGEFIDANETLSKEELEVIVGLEVGERTEWFGGGAAPEWAVKRIQ